jgi:hypothetical protein
MGFTEKTKWAFSLVDNPSPAQQVWVDFIICDKNKPTSLHTFGLGQSYSLFSKAFKESCPTLTSSKKIDFTIEQLKALKEKLSEKLHNNEKINSWSDLSNSFVESGLNLGFTGIPELEAKGYWHDIRDAIVKLNSDLINMVTGCIASGQTMTVWSF